jgi:S1-C subfamily serine protease
MFRSAVALAVLAILAVAVPAEQPLDPAVAAVQKAVQDGIAKASPSVVCILVSRSEDYKQFGALPPPDSPGRLGAFDGKKLREDAQKSLNRTREALVDRLDLANPNHIPESFGSGIVLDPAGLILTNYHVVREATKLYVRLPGHEPGSYADILAADPRSDLAVLKLLTPPTDLKALPLGRGEDLQPGQFVLALTNTFARGFSDTGASADWGIVSAVRCRALMFTPDTPDPEDRSKTLYHYRALIQTSAKLNAGCSGGALLNLKGELVGISSSVAFMANSEAPGGYALPFDTGMRRIVAKLKAGQEVEYGFLGVTYASPGADDPPQINNVIPGSPADRAGIPKNQRILKVDGIEVHRNSEASLLIGTALAGNTVRLLMTAPGGGAREFTAQLVKYYVTGSFIASERPPAVGGLRVDYTSTLVKGNEFHPHISPGVVVREVTKNSPAEKADIQVERIILKVNDQPVSTPAEYYKMVGDSTGPIVLTLQKGTTGEQTVKLERR